MTAAQLANITLYVHVLFISGVVIPVPLILLGGVLKWRWIRNFWFRMAHLAMIGFVVAESLFHIRCPLTTLENTLRSQAGEQGNGDSFIAYWMHRLFFYRFEPMVFTVVYGVFGLLVVVLLILYPPQRRRPLATS